MQIAPNGIERHNSGIPEGRAGFFLNSSRGYQPHIDGLGAIAVLVVIFYHLDVAYFGGGFVGVDIFLSFQDF
jgi:hypothetical protein